MFDDNKRKKDDEFDKMIREMQKIIEEVFKNAFGFENIFTEGFSARFTPEGEIKIIGKEEPNKDIIEEGNKIYVTIELPNVDEKKLKVKAKDKKIEIMAGDEIKIIELPAKVKARSMRKAFKNGVLDIELEKA